MNVYLSKRKNLLAHHFLTEIKSFETILSAWYSRDIWKRLIVSAGNLSGLNKRLQTTDETGVHVLLYPSCPLTVTDFRSSRTKNARGCQLLSRSSITSVHPAIVRPSRSFLQFASSLLLDPTSSKPTRDLSLCLLSRLLFWESSLLRGEKSKLIY